MARPIRGQVLSLRESEFVLAAIGLGVPSHRILLRDILPNVSTTLIVFVPLMMALNMLTESALSFLSIGVQPPDASWGSIIQDGQGLLYSRPWVALAPGIAIVLCVLALECAWRWLARRARPPFEDQIGAGLMLLPLLQRLGQMLFVMFGISMLVFLIFFATPGSDPASRIAGRGASPEILEAVRKSFGLDQPFYVQYFVMMKKIFITGDLTSFVNRGWKVVPAVLDTVPVTLSLVIGAAILWVIFGMLIGIVAAATRGSWLDKLLMILGLIGISMPVFWLGEVMNLVSQSRFHDTWMFSWVPPLGYKNLSDDPKGWFLTLIIPWITLAILYIGLYGRVLRASLIEAMQEDYIRTARAKGLSETRILLRHALRTSLISFVTLFGLDFGALVGGSALLTEVVFNLQGSGQAHLRCPAKP